MDNLQRLLTDPEVTDFVVVAIPKSEHNPNPTLTLTPTLTLALTLTLTLTRWPYRAG